MLKKSIGSLCVWAVLVSSALAMSQEDEAEAARAQVFAKQQESMGAKVVAVADPALANALQAYTTHVAALAQRCPFTIPKPGAFDPRRMVEELNACYCKNADRFYAFETDKARAIQSYLAAHPGAAGAALVVKGNGVNSFLTPEDQRSVSLTEYKRAHHCPGS
jgi:hypothetical protein